MDENSNHLPRTETKRKANQRPVSLVNVERKGTAAATEPRRCLGVLRGAGVFQTVLFSGRESKLRLFPATKSLEMRVL